MENTEDITENGGTFIDVQSPVIGKMVTIHEVPDAGMGWRVQEVFVEDRSGVAWFDPPA